MVGLSVVTAIDEVMEFMLLSSAVVSSDAENKPPPDLNERFMMAKRSARISRSVAAYVQDQWQKAKLIFDQEPIRLLR